MGTGDQAGTWGATTNNNFQYILEQAIAGYQQVSITSSNQVLTYLNGASSTASQNQSIYAALQLIGATGAFNVFTPNSATKLYIFNNATSYAATIAVSSSGSPTTPAGTTITIPAGLTAAVYTDGTNFYTQHNYLPGNVSVGGVASATSFSGAGTGLTGTAASLSIGGNAATATTATSVANLSGGAAGEVLYQSAANTTAFTTVGTNGQVLASAGAGTPYWTTNISGNATNVTGTVAIANGGTGQITATAAFTALSPITTNGDLIIGNVSNVPARLPIGANGYVLTSNGTTASWQPSSTGGTVPISLGGTGQTTATAAFNALSPITTIGDLIIGNNTNSAGRLAIGASGYVLTSNGSSATWQPVSVSGTVPISNGGTGQTTASAGFNALSPITTTGDLIIGNGTNSATRLGIGTNGYVLTSNGSTATWQPSSGGGGGVTYFSAGTTGFTPNSSTSGSVTLAGTLNVANGGTGLTSTPVNGAIDIGNGTGFTRTTLTAGANVTITNGAGSITIAASGSGGGGVPSVTGTANQVLVNGGSGTAVTTAATLTLASTINVNTTGNAAGVSSGSWTISISGTKIYFAYGGTNKGSLDSSGNFIVTGNVTAYGTP